MFFLSNVRCCSFPGVFDFTNDGTNEGNSELNASFDWAENVNKEMVIHSPDLRRSMNFFANNVAVPNGTAETSFHSRFFFLNADAMIQNWKWKKRKIEFQLWIRAPPFPNFDHKTRVRLNEKYRFRCDRIWIIIFFIIKLSTTARDRVSGNALTGMRHWMLPSECLFWFRKWVSVFALSICASAMSLVAMGGPQQTFGWMRSCQAARVY